MKKNKDIIVKVGCFPTITIPDGVSIKDWVDSGAFKNLISRTAIFYSENDEPQIKVLTEP